MLIRRPPLVLLTGARMPTGDPLTGAGSPAFPMCCTQGTVEPEVALQAQRSTSYALTGLLEAEAGWNVLVPPVGSSLGDGSDVAHFGGEVGLATSSTHDDSEGVGGLGSVERVGPQPANVTGGYVLPAAWNAVEAGAVPPKRPSPRSWPREGASDPDGDSWSSNRPRKEFGLLQVELAVAGDRLARPEGSDHLERFVDPAGPFAIAHGRTEAASLSSGVVADTNAQHEASAGDVINCGRLSRDRPWLSPRQWGDDRRQRHTFGG